MSRYFEYKDRLNFLNVKYEVGNALVFVLPMPKSWSKKKKLKMDGRPHTQTPDKDNLEKALLDAIYPDDSAFWWSGPIMKVWGEVGKLIVISNGPDQWAIRYLCRGFAESPFTYGQG